MTIQEFSAEFDLLFNNITSNQAPGLNSYEKSVFLTKAQLQLVNEYFNNRTDGIGGGFDGSQKRQYDFSSIIRTEKLFDVNTFKERINTTEKLDKRSKVFLFPYNYFLAVNEILSDDRQQYSVTPLNYPEYQRLMLKPYNFPVKRGAWRILTDKKNCNYWREYVKATDEQGNYTDINTDTDYIFLSGWADQKRTLQVTITSKNASSPIDAPWDAIEDTSIICSDGKHPKIGRNGTSRSIFFEVPFNYERVWRQIKVVNVGWNSSYQGTVYDIDLEVIGSSEENTLDDNDTIELLKIGFNLLNNYVKTEDWEDEWWKDMPIVKAATHTDGFQMCSAPSKRRQFHNGKTFTTEVIQVPLAEIIGKFTGELNYQLRYIRTLTPIILDNLDKYGTNLTIGGVKQATECKLPEETHQEILERAVTLAKIAWQGGTATQAAEQQ